MSVTPGNDPFSGSNTRNILQHIISPKIVNDGSGGYQVKTDLINIDNAYSESVIVQDSAPNSDKLTITTDSTKSYITTTTSTGTRSEFALVGADVEIKNPDNSGNGFLLLQTDVNGDGYIRAGQNGAGTEKLYLGTGSTNTLIVTPSGNVGIGTNTPTVILHAVSSQNADCIQLTSQGFPQFKLRSVPTSGDAVFYQSTTQQGLQFYDTSLPIIIKYGIGTNVIYVTPTTNIVTTPTGFGGKSTGTVTANNTNTVNVSNTNVTADSIILLTVKTPTGANAGQAYINSKTASTGFSIASGAADTSVYNYMILN